MTRFRAERPVRPLRGRVGSADLTRRTDQRSLNRRQRISLMLAVRTGDAWTQRAHHDRLIGTKTRRVGWAAGQLERLRTVSLYPGLGLLVGSDGLRCIRCQGPRRARLRNSGFRVILSRKAWWRGGLSCGLCRAGPGAGTSARRRCRFIVRLTAGQQLGLIPQGEAPRTAMPRSSGRDRLRAS
jgi:hypothetical protein